MKLENALLPLPGNSVAVGAIELTGDDERGVVKLNLSNFADGLRLARQFEIDNVYLRIVEDDDLQRDEPLVLLTRRLDSESGILISPQAWADEDRELLTDDGFTDLDAVEQRLREAV